MNSSTSNIREARRGIALVITLLMLSVITFLAVAFLVMTNRDTSAKVATLDVSMAQGMAEAGLARAEAEVAARMTAATDDLAFDYMASSNFYNPYGYISSGRTATGVNLTNVNYDYYSSGTVMSSLSANDWAQNIANLFFDPRPPVFVLTNTDPTKPSAEFRYYVDLNRNGAFEGGNMRSTNTGDNTTLRVISNTSGQGGEPEWIGVLADPTRPHGRDNPFVGRYAYMVLPIGKTLDLNFIHNESQRFLDGGTGALNPIPTTPNSADQYVRDQGVGSWELNLAGFLRDLDTNIYGEQQSYVPASEVYQYNYPTGPPQYDARPDFGYAFDDAKALYAFRAAGPYQGQYLLNILGNNLSLYAKTNGIDEYGVGPLTILNGPFDFTGASVPQNNISLMGDPWPGSYPSNMLFDMQDLFNPTMSSSAFTNRLMTAGAGTGLLPLWSRYTGNTAAVANREQYDRYTFQRLLATIGTGSAPENSTYVYTNEIAGFPGLPQTMLRTKMNLNYDNSAQMAGGPYTPMTNTPTPWTDAHKFFTNAADLLLRTQDFPITNALYGYWEFHHFGFSGMFTNFPIYVPPTVPNSTNYHYTAQFHRMLQLAANLWDEGHNTNTYLAGTFAGSNVYNHFPTVFRPQFMVSNNYVFITNYAVVTNAATQYLQPWRYLTNGAAIAADDNVYGIPWVVGTVKGTPGFNQYCVDTAVSMTRKLNVTRPGPSAKASRPNATNQIYLMSISNSFGIGAWNPYVTPINNRQLNIYASVQMEITVTNNSTTYPWGTNIFINTNLFYTTNTWAGWTQKKSDSSFSIPFLANSNYFTSRNQSQPLVYSDRAGAGGANNAARGIWDVSDTRRVAFDTNCFAVHGWVVNITNYVRYLVQDAESRYALDFVNIGPFGTSVNITNAAALLSGTGTAGPLVGGGLGFVNQYVWNPNPVSGVFGPNSELPGTTATPGAPLSIGEYNQLRIGAGLLTVSDYQQAPGGASSLQFLNFLEGNNATTNNMTCPLAPTLDLIAHSTWAANDPLVHYTIEDLTPPGFSNYIQSVNPVFPIVLTNSLGQVSARYDPWPTVPKGPFGNTLGPNYGLKDAGITNAEAWNFPTSLYPNVGWIGRVHRGTPWQTIYLKADPNPTGNDSTTNLWTTQWMGDWSRGLDSPGPEYPTNDWFLLDLFTTAPSDNALRGTLSVNQTNTAPWHALLDGVIVLSNSTTGIVGVPINPAEAIETNANLVSYIMDSEDGLNNLRTNQFSKLFHHVGDILRSPTLTIASPYINSDTKAVPVTDELLERIPQQIAGLLKVGEPQFVIYSWGQSLRPAALFNSATAPTALFKIPTNYSITGEYLTRTVCHLDLTKSDRFGTNPVLQVDSFNILPAAQ